MRRALSGLLLFALVFMLISIDAFAAAKSSIKLETMQPNGLFYFSCYLQNQGKTVTIQVRKVNARYTASANDGDGYVTTTNPKTAAQKSCDQLNGYY